MATASWGEKPIVPSTGDEQSCVPTARLSSFFHSGGNITQHSLTTWVPETDEVFKQARRRIRGLGAWLSGRALVEHAQSPKSLD